jgi:uncharacterized repeat protein (TIGR01451 family)
MSLNCQVRHNSKVKKISRSLANLSSCLGMIGGGIAMLCPSFFTEGAIAQSVNGPLRWNDPGIQWTPGASEQTYGQFSCPSNPNRVTISFFGDYDRENSNTTPSTILPIDLTSPIGTGGGPARDILFTAMGNLPPSNPGYQRRDRQARIVITFDSPVSLGNFFMADIDRSIAGNLNTRWIDQVEVTANGGTLIPGAVAGTSFTGGSAVSISGNVATGIGDSPNAGPNSNFGNVNIDFGPNLITSIEIIYRNAPNATGVDGQIEAQGITLGDISFANPCLEATKQVGTPTDLGGGIFSVPYTLSVENSGNVPISNVQIAENLAQGLGLTLGTPPLAPGQYRVAIPPTTAAPLVANPNFNGSSDPNLLIGGTLPPEQRQTVNLTLEIRPLNPFTPTDFDNEIVASGSFTPPGGATIDLSDRAAANVTLPPGPVPRIGVAKSATNVVDATPNIPNDGLFNLDYLLLVENFGNVELTDIQLTEDFASQFGLTYTPGAPGIGQYTVLTPPTTIAPLAANNNFTGSDANTGLLNPAGSTLAVGQRQTVTLTVQVHVNPADLPLILDNQVQATGNGGGQTTSDLSNDGTNGPDPNNPDPDPDGDRNPRNNEIPTRVALPINQPIPRIGIAKESPNTAPPIVSLGDGRFNIPYTIVVENAGTDNLRNVQVAENFEAAEPLGFGLTYVPGTPEPGQYTLLGQPSTSRPLSINPGFTGSAGGSINLLDASNSNLPLGERREINFTVQVFPASLPVTLNNQAQATGTGVRSQQEVRDDSVDGLNTSPDSDLNPNNNSGPTPVMLPPMGSSTGGELILVKRITGVTRAGQALPGVDFSRFVDDPSDLNDNRLNGTSLTPVGEVNVEGLQSGDEVEYTVYYLAGGTEPVTNARICDLVPEGTTFVANGFGGDSGILLRQGTTEVAQTNAADGDRGRFFSPLGPVNSVIPPCPTNTTNPNGAVFVNLGDIPNTGPNQTGFLRFRVRLD